jgi:hypothetical protein
MTEFLILTDTDDNKLLISVQQISYVKRYAGGYSSIVLTNDTKLTVKESVQSIIETMRELNNLK